MEATITDFNRQKNRMSYVVFFVQTDRNEGYGDSYTYKSPQTKLQFS